MNNLKFPLDFALALGKLKYVKRAGWLRYSKITEVESVSDHSFRMSLLSLLLFKEKDIDINKCMKMSLIHDLAESIVGDITPYDGISKEEKKKLEENAMKSIVEGLPKELFDIFFGLWNEYENESCEEAKIVKDLDKYEMLLQAFDYENKYGENLEEFYKSIEVIKTPVIKEWAQQLIIRRNEKK